MNRFDWGNRRFSIGVLNAALASSALLAFGQKPMPPPGDKHFCEWWQARIGPASDPKTPQPRPSRRAPEPENSSAQSFLDDFGTAAPVDPDRVGEMDESTILAAIACLFQLEDDSRPASFMGVTWAGVSQIFDTAPMNLAALYYISYLFTCNWKHGNAIALRGPGAEVSDSKSKYQTTPWAIYKAYVSYRRWYQQVKAMGLANARAEKLDPLAGTGLYWY